MDVIVPLIIVSCDQRRGSISSPRSHFSGFPQHVHPPLIRLLLARLFRFFREGIGSTPNYPSSPISRPSHETSTATVSSGGIVRNVRWIV